MKKIIKVFLLVLLLTVTLCGCSKKKPTTPPKPKDVKVTALHESISIKDTEVKNYDFTTLFTITEDEKIVQVKNEYLTNLVKEEAGIYSVTCEYSGKNATTEVTVVATAYSIELTTEVVTINQSLVLSYDFKALFTAKIDGKIIPITDDMVSTDVKDEIGNYTYTVTVGNISKTLRINVTNNHEIVIIKSYEQLELEISKVSIYDYTSLFTIYVDGKITKTTAEMIDLSAIQNAVVGEIYDITLTYQLDDSSKSETVKVEIVKDEEIIVNSKNIVTYPNGENIDLTTLFEIRKGDAIIPVTMDMIEGTIDYSNVGINTIRLNFNKQVYEATVEVKKGVVINYAKSDHIIINLGTDQTNYLFSDDFIVIINGLRFDTIPEKYLDLSTVDFNTEGIYEVTISIPYNDKNLSLSGPKFDYIESTIVYDVRGINYEIKLESEEVIIPTGTTSFDPLKNISVKINGIRQTLTSNPDWASTIACYVKVTSNDINLEYSGIQEVVVEVYVYGPEKDPVIVNYQVMTEADLQIETIDQVIFTGETLYTKDLFKVTSGNQEIDVDQSMIFGKVDVFTPGVYEILFDYQGITATAKVVVLNTQIKGTYKTNMKTIPTVVVSDNEEEEDTIIPGIPLKDMVFEDLNNIVINDRQATVVSAIDENTLLIKISDNIYTLYYYDGIIVVDPNNDIKLGFNDYRRPLVYFSDAKYVLEAKLDINYGVKHVLETTYTSYSIDTFKYQNKETLETKWFGLKIRLAEKTSADTIYQVTWGEVIYPSDFEAQTNVNATIEFNGEQYDITVIDRRTAKINRPDIQKILANMTFTGTINGQNATIKVDSYGGYQIMIGQTLYQEYGSYETGRMYYGGVNLDTNEVYLYGYEDEVKSIKFTIDLENKTFIHLAQDQYFGKYVTNNRYIYLDGYGGGMMNFSSSSYYTTRFNYTINGNVMNIKFVDTEPSFAYGETMSLYISDLLNRLTVKESFEGKLKGEIFDNIEITTGALINISDYTVGADTDAIARPNFLKNIQIITKDGELNDAEKLKCINFKKVSFSKPGFYEFTITIDVNGVSVTSVYAIQVIEAIYDGNPLVSSYGNGILYNENGFMIDKYGRGILNTNDGAFKGNVVINGNSFIMKGYNEQNLSISLSGTLISEGVLLVSCYGGANFNDYFTTGTHRAAGTNNFILHEFVANNVATYILAKSTTGTGEIVELELLGGSAINANNAILRVIAQDSEAIIQVTNWNSITEGIKFSDGYRGTYTKETEDELILDGFGGAKLGTLTGTYTISKNNLTFVSSTVTKVLSLNKATYTYEIVEITLDNSLLEGKTFIGTYQFFCSNYMYTATTSFSFEAGGIVIITSTSSSHDDGEDACTDDKYEPPFASIEGTQGTYNVKGNKVTVIVGEYSFEFIITDVMNVSIIKCSATNLSSDAHGYFKIETTFTK